MTNSDCPGMDCEKYAKGRKDAKNYESRIRETCRRPTRNAVITELKGPK